MSAIVTNFEPLIISARQCVKLTFCQIDILLKLSFPLEWIYQQLFRQQEVNKKVVNQVAAFGQSVHFFKTFLSSENSSKAQV